MDNCGWKWQEDAVRDDGLRYKVNEQEGIQVNSFHRLSPASGGGDIVLGLGREPWKRGIGIGVRKGSGAWNWNQNARNAEPRVLHHGCWDTTRAPIFLVDKAQDEIQSVT